jgi:uncharacterized membrane protein YjgN (DUF898 family)
VKLISYIWSAASPFILACLPVLLLLNYVRAEILPEEIIPSIIAVELFALVCLLVFLAIFRSRYKATIAASACVAFTFTFRIWQVCLALYFPVGAYPLVGLVSVGAFFLLQVLLIFAFLNGRWQFRGREIKIDLRRVCHSLTLVALVLVAANWLPIYLFETQQEALAAKLKSEMGRQFSALKLDIGAGRPDFGRLCQPSDHVRALGL